MPERPLEPDASTLDSMTSACVAFVRAHLLSLAAQPSFDVDDPEPLCAAFREPPPLHGAQLEELLLQLGPAIAKSFNTAGPGYLAFIPGGGIYASALADYIALSVNRYVGVNKTAPVLAQIEATAIGWLAELLGCAKGTRGILTTGGSLSNFTAIVTARTSKLPEDFLKGTLYISEETHLSVVKAARLAGFPARSIRRVAVDARLRLVPAALERAIEEDRARGLQPFMVVANVGTTNTGAIDPVPEIADIAERHGLWLHADAAYGGFFRLVPGFEARMPGLERCDSITLDPHKGLFLPYGTGCLLVKDPDALRRAHESDADYLRDVAPEEGQHNFTDLSPELSRDFRGIRLWLPLKLYGVAAFTEQLVEKLALARRAYEALKDDARFDVLDEPQLTVVPFRLRARAAGGALRGAGDVAGEDLRNAELLRRVNARRRVFLSSTTIGGRYTLRICVLSFRTHEDRLDEAISALKEESIGL